MNENKKFDPVNDEEDYKELENAILNEKDASINKTQKFKRVYFKDIGDGHSSFEDKIVKPTDNKKGDELK